MSILYKAIYENNWSDAKAFIDGHPCVLEEDFAASTTSETPLHVAAKFGRVDIVEELVKLLSPKYLEIRGAGGFTPLLIAASHSGVIPIAKCLINKNSDALAIPTTDLPNMIPVTAAFHHGFNEMGRYLYSVTPSQVFKPENVPLLLKTCFQTGDKLDIVLDLLQQSKELLFSAEYGYTTVQLIAGYLPNSLNKSQLPFLKRWLYHYIKIPSTTITEHFCVDIQQEDEMNKAHQGLGLHRFISRIYNLLGIKEICKMKLQHAQAEKILNLTCENLKFLNEEKKRMIRKALKAAVQSENVEFLLRVTKANLELLTLVTLYQRDDGQVFFDAVEYRKAEIFNLLPGFRFKHVVAAQRSTEKNTLLHIAALLAPASQLNRISGAALQMQRELQWFKAVERMTNPAHKLILNDKNLSPMDFFKKNHKELRDKGEKWMKGTASSCSVVGALIVTIMFTAAITVPGGNNQTSGYPMFLKEKLFKVFLISDARSLFSSTTSVLTFLGILTSRYAEEDFLYSLPTKLIIGLSTLFLSIATMMIAFSATVIIMSQNNSSGLWALLPVTILTGVPVILFVLLQFPLLVEVISSTYYGPGLSKKKVTWP